MTSTYSPNLNLQLQGVGDNPNTWGTTLNNNVFTNIDMALGSPFAPDVSGGLDYTLSSTNALNMYHAPTGTLTGNINYIFPANCGRILLFNNGTSGSFSLTVKSSGGTGVVIPQGSIAWVFINSSGNVASIPFSIYCEQNIASATTCDIASTQSNMVLITGTTAITSFGSSASQTKPLYFVRFNGALTLTHNATSLILPGAANIVTAAGDAAIFEYMGSGNWRCLFYQKANGNPLSQNNVDIIGGTIDNTVVGGSTPAAGHFTTISATGDITGSAKVICVSPNSGTTGGIQVRDASGNPGKAILQFTDNTAASEYADFTVDASGNVTLNSAGQYKASKQFGAWAGTHTAGTIYQAASDGFVTTYATASSSPASLTGITDSNASPTQTVNAQQVTSGIMGFCFPVRKGDYWKVTQTNCNTPTIFWLPLGA